MRKYPLIFLIILLALAIGATACDSGSSAPAAKSPQELLTAARTANQDASAQSGSYEVAVTIAADAAKFPAEAQGIAQAFLGKPIVISGDFAAVKAPLAADISVSTSLMGMSLNAGVTMLEGNAYLNVLGQWYETPDEVTQQLAQPQMANISEDVQQVMTDLDIDPMNWCTDIKAAGEETLVDTEVVHLTANLDMQKMLTDATALMQSEEFAQLLAAAGSAEQSPLGELPSAAELEAQLAEVDEMFQNAKVDFWIAKSDETMRKMTLTTDLVMPAELAASGLTGANVVATMNLNKPGQAVNIKAPASPKPFAALQQDIQANPLFGLLLGALSGSGSGDLLGF